MGPSQRAVSCAVVPSSSSCGLLSNNDNPFVWPFGGVHCFEHQDFNVLTFGGWAACWRVSHARVRRHASLVLRGSEPLFDAVWGCRGGWRASRDSMAGPGSPCCRILVSAFREGPARACRLPSWPVLSPPPPPLSPASLPPGSLLLPPSCILQFLICFWLSNHVRGIGPE